MLKQSNSRHSKTCQRVPQRKKRFTERSSIFKLWTGPVVSYECCCWGMDYGVASLSDFGCLLVRGVWCLLEEFGVCSLKRLWFCSLKEFAERLLKDFGVP